MKLNVVVGSPNARKVLSVLNHIGDIDVDIVYYDFFEGELRTPEYHAINPNNMVPCLEDGDFSLWESNAIIQYLCDKSSNNDLYPEDHKTRADINRWLFWDVAHYNKALGTIVFEEIAKQNFMGSPGNAALIMQANEDLKRFAAILNNHMKDREFVVGNHMTIADYALTHVEFFKDSIDFDWSDYPNVNAMYDRIRQNTNWTSTAPADITMLGRKPAA